MGPCQTQLFETVETTASGDRVAALFEPSPLPIKTDGPFRQLQNQKITLSSIFPTRQEENKLTKARRILGEIGKDIPDPIFETHLTEFQYLVDSWLDEYERSVFDNKTLKEVLWEG